MGRETRRGRGRYYTRSRKVNGEVVREYVGTGAVAELAAEQDADARRRRQEERERQQREAVRWEPAVAALTHVGQVLDGLAAAAFIAAGYHRHHRGEWRRRRHGTLAEA